MLLFRGLKTKNRAQGHVMVEVIRSNYSPTPIVRDVVVRASWNLLLPGLALLSQSCSCRSRRSDPAYGRHIIQTAKYALLKQ